MILLRCQIQTACLNKTPQPSLVRALFGLNAMYLTLKIRGTLFSIRTTSSSTNVARKTVPRWRRLLHHGRRLGSSSNWRRSLNMAQLRRQKGLWRRAAVGGGTHACRAVLQRARPNWLRMESRSMLSSEACGDDVGVRIARARGSGGTWRRWSGVRGVRARGSRGTWWTWWTWWCVRAVAGAGDVREAWMTEVDPS